MLTASEDGGQVPVIEVEGLVKRYGDRTAVDGVDLTVEQGEVFAVLGPNGAGKSTTVESIAGLRVPDAGRIRVLGLDPQRDGAELRQRLGVQLQESRFADRIMVGEAVELFASFYREPADVDTLLDELDLARHRDVRFAKLSGGLRQRLSIAVALAGNPEVAILDELTTGLDPVARREAWEMVDRLRHRGVTVVLVTHFMEEAERLADRVALIDRGRLVAVDTPEGLVELAGPGRRITFVPSDGFDPATLGGLPEVAAVEAVDGEVVVTGSGDLLSTVVAALTAHGVVARRLRFDESTLDDAFVALTGRQIEADRGEE